MREVNGKPIRTARGGSRNRKDWNKSVAADVQSILDTGSTSKVVAHGKKGYTPAMNEHYAGRETYKDYIVPRRSITETQQLGIAFPKIETVAMKSRQLDKGKIIFPGEDPSSYMIETTDQRVVWRSDKTLLNRSKVDQFGEGNGTLFPRMTSRSKRIDYSEREIKINMDAELNLRGDSVITDGTELPDDIL
jgi:hypothetical protein